MSVPTGILATFDLLPLYCSFLSAVWLGCMFSAVYINHVTVLQAKSILPKFCSGVISGRHDFKV